MSTIKIIFAGHWWLTLVILGTQEAEIRRTAVRSQPRQIVHETLSRKNPSQKRTGGVAQGIGPEFKPQYQKQKIMFSDDYLHIEPQIYL
jgi:hypothetical protein